jgi:hypothetical protein
MFFDAPTWAEIKAANLAYPAMIAAWVAAIGTCGAAVFAFFAVRWARKAAIEAARQATAALDAVKWSQKAAEAAQEQIKVLERQVELSEPQPIILLHFSYSAWEISQGWNMSVENVGEELAFDVQVSALYTGFEGASVATALTFGRIPVLKAGHDVPLLPKVEPPLFSLGESESLSQSQRFMQVLLTAQEQRAKKEGITQKNICMDVMNVRYRNARGQLYEMQFDLWMRNFVRFEAEPHGSLLRRQVEHKPGIIGPIYFSVREGTQEVLKSETLYEAAKSWNERPDTRSVYAVGRAASDELQVGALRVPENDLKRELENARPRERT